MTNMKRITSLLTAFCLLFLATGFTGCEEGKGSVSQSKSNLQIAQEVSQKIMDSLIAKDEEALFLMLKQRCQEFYLTREQISTAFDFFDGEIISYNLPTTTGGGGNLRKEEE